MHGQQNVKKLETCSLQSIKILMSVSSNATTKVLFKVALTNIHVTSSIQCVDKVLIMRIKIKIKRPVQLHNLCSTEWAKKSKYPNLIRQVAEGREQGINIIRCKKPQRKREFGASGWTQDEDSIVTHAETDYVSEHHIFSCSSRDDGHEPPLSPYILYHRVIKTVCYGTKL
jgi:hypothetical protein